MRIAILGGGVAGLTCAHYLARSGHTPFVLEPSGALGQLGAPIVHEGLRIEADLSTLAYRTRDAEEGMQAFVDKRKAEFRDE